MSPVPELDDLIESVGEQASGDDALARLEAAAEISQGLNALADDLLGHFVDEARTTGASWSQIGEKLRVTKQAAQQRFELKRAMVVKRLRHAVAGLGKLERFTPSAKKTLAAAIAEAHKLNHNYVGTEHILMGLLSEPAGLAAKALDSLGITVVSIRERVTELIGLGDISKLDASPSSRKPPYTPRARKVLELSFKEALQLGHNYIGTEHVLLALIAEGEGIAAQVLMSLGADHGKTRAKILELLSSR